MQSKSAATNKAKDKKAARKAAAEKVAASQLLVKKLRQDDDLLAPFPAFRTFNRNGLALQLAYHTAESLPSELKNWTFDLTQRNVKSFYENCPGWGWNASKKRRELEDSDARFIVATAAAAVAEGEEKKQTDDDGDGDDEKKKTPEFAVDQPIGFVHLRLEIEDDNEPVLYVYEFHVEEGAQGRGLGRYLMQLTELISRKAGLARIMLTVFKENKAAIALYTKLGYVMDEDSPGAVDPSGDHGYEILSKKLVSPAAAAAPVAAVTVAA